jgi:hypothetical protein
MVMEGEAFASAVVRVRQRSGGNRRIVRNVATGGHQGMTTESRSRAPRLADLHGADGLLANGSLPAAILVGAGVGLAILGLSIASLWQWLGR